MAKILFVTLPMLSLRFLDQTPVHNLKKQPSTLEEMVFTT
jgi:hypothetical protein